MALHRQFSLFLGVGVAATVVDYGTLTILTEFLGFDPVVAAQIGYLLGGAVSYTLNRLLTFQTNRSHMEAGWRFLTVMAVGFCLTGVIMYVLTKRLDIPYFYARVAATGMVFFWNFIAHKIWTFAAKSGQTRAWPDT